MIFTTNKSLNQWGKVLHDQDLAAAILDRVLERGRLPVSSTSMSFGLYQYVPAPRGAQLGTPKKSARALLFQDNLAEGRMTSAGTQVTQDYRSPEDVCGSAAPKGE
jgi:hypothetical protein